MIDFNKYKLIILIINWLIIILYSELIWALTPNVRVLIDISGSMRHNDPHNLRVPAVRLVSELLPNDAHAGIWIFAEKTDLLVPPGIVNAQWKNKTREQVNKINSRGLFTNIEQAIATALTGWEQPDATQERHLILMTDGLVDVSPVATESAASRARILAEQIPKLKAAQIKVHAIALSNQVDTDLLKALTRQTDGWLETARTAGNLQRVFLHLLEQTAPPTTVPLKGNQFTIDNQVSEFTLLAFRGDASTLELLSPTGQKFSAQQHPANVQWREEAGYNLVTINHPKPGHWEFQGVTDPDNRVAIVTDLGIASGAIPALIQQGTTPRLEAWLTNHGQPVTRPDFLHLINGTATLNLTEINQDNKDNQELKKLALSPPAENGHFSLDLDAQVLNPGVYQLQIVLDGGTFQRQLERRVKITGLPIVLHYEQKLPTAENPTAELLVTITPEADLIDPKSIFGYLRLQGSNGQQITQDLPPFTNSQVILHFSIPTPGIYQAQLRLQAQLWAGNTLVLEPQPTSIEFNFSNHSTTDLEKPSLDQHETHQFSWLNFSEYFLGANALLAILFGLTWWFLKIPPPSTQSKSQPENNQEQAT